MESVDAFGDTVRQGVRWGAIPIANYSTDRGLSTGLMAERFDYGQGILPFHTHLALQLRFATRGPRDVFVAYQRTGVTPWRLRIASTIALAEDKYQRFYGFGKGAVAVPELEREGYYFYTERNLLLRNSARLELAQGVFLEGALALAHVTNKMGSPNSLYASVFGQGTERFLYTLIQSSLIRDTRDFEFVPSKGSFLSVTLGLAPGLLSERAGFGRFDFDFRSYDGIVPGRWLWLASQLRYTASSASAPLHEKARLGSFGTLRGLPYNRYLSNHSVSVRTELRSLWFRRTVFGLPLKAGNGVFVDAGSVGEPRWAWGLTFFGSYFTDDFLGVADLGFSREGVALYLRIGHAI